MWTVYYAFTVTVISALAQQPVDILNVNYSTCAGSLVTPYDTSKAITSLNWTRGDNFFYTFINKGTINKGFDWNGQVTYCSRNVSKNATLPTPLTDGDWTTMFALSAGTPFFLGMQILSTFTNGVILKPDNQWYWVDGRSVDWGDPVMRGNFEIIYLQDNPGGYKNSTRVYFTPALQLVDTNMNTTSYFHCQLKSNLLSSFQK
jgi:hypothetical protein